MLALDHPAHVAHVDRRTVGFALEAAGLARFVRRARDLALLVAVWNLAFIAVVPPMRPRSMRSAIDSCQHSAVLGDGGLLVGSQFTQYTRRNPVHVSFFDASIDHPGVRFNWRSGYATDSYSRHCRVLCICPRGMQQGADAASRCANCFAACGRANRAARAAGHVIDRHRHVCDCNGQSGDKSNGYAEQRGGIEIDADGRSSRQ